MNKSDLMVRFLNSINFSDHDRFDLDFEAVVKNPFNSKQLDMIIVKETPWSYELLYEFIHAIGKISYPVTFTFHYKKKANIENKTLLFSHWYEINYYEQFPINIVANDDTLIIHYEDEMQKEQFDAVFNEFNELIKFINYEVSIEHIVQPPLVILDEKKVAKLNKKAEKVIDLEPDNPLLDNEQIHKGRQPVAEEILFEDLKENFAQMVKEREQARKFKKGDYLATEIGQFQDQTGNVDFDGMIYSLNIRETNNGKLMALIGVGANGHGVNAIAFSNEKILSEDKLKQLRIGDYIRVRGATGLDRRSNELSVTIHYLNSLPKPALREDKSPYKRVELHLHSKMSTMDGVGDIYEYAKLAAHMGHPALAISDHGVVQAFPDAQKAGKANNIKIIYGSEMYMYDAPKYIDNSRDIQLDNASYVAFDLETTGLSQGYDKIIEFGAVRIHNGIVVQSIDILINPGPGITLSKKIQELTNITPKMLTNKMTISEVLPKILEFIKDDVLVTHNADFDIGFLNTALLENGYPVLSNPIVDTLMLSRNIFSDASSHRLGSLARKLEVVYEEGKAHRADYDAQVLGQVWVSMQAILADRYNIKLHSDIDKLPMPENMIKNIFPYHIIVLAKNEAGLKELFKLISTSHIDYWADIPRIPRKLISKSRENLLIGSACFNGELFSLASRKTYQELVDATAFYDYVELQPLENYRYLIEMDEIESPQRLKEILYKMVAAAEANKKLVVATGDVHYVNPEDKIYRDVYIYAKGRGNVNHPMMPYSREHKNHFENPDQHYRSTTEMIECFSWLGEDKAIEYVSANSLAINEMIEKVNPIKDKLFTPKIEEADQYIKDLCYAQAQAIYGKPLPTKISDRLEAELRGIIKNGYAVIYYIAHKIVKKANEDGFIVGSRGSVGSSLVATMCGITEVNPLEPHYVCPTCQYSEFSEDSKIRSGFDLDSKLCPSCLTPLKGEGQNIPFATFIGFEAEKVPDIDLNFPADYQAQAHDYARELLGEKNIFRAGTIETVAEKTAFGYVKGYYERLGIDLATVSKADIAYLAYGCQGVKRTTGQHPGGLTVVPEQFDIHDFTPIQYPADKSEGNAITTHFDFDAIHDNILKLDLLGHVDPQALKMMSELTNINIDDIPLNDQKVLSLFTSDRALERTLKTIRSLDNGILGIPEFGTQFAMGIVSKAKPTTFADLVIISGLAHGRNVWRGNSENLIDEQVTDLRGIIGCRDDIMTYLISKSVPAKTAFAIMEDVRRGRKVKEEFVKVMQACHVPQYYIDSCNKIEYLFPKAHATAYVMMAVRVAWFKVYYPLAYYATYFSLRSKQFDIKTMLMPAADIYQKIENMRLQTARQAKGLTPKEEEVQYTLKMTLEMLERGYHIKNIDLDKSDAFYFLLDEKNKAIIPPFVVIDGVGLNAASSIVTARQEKPFLSRQDLLARTKISSTNLDDLAKLGVLNHLDESSQMSLFSFDDF